MKKNIHPNYSRIKVLCNCGNSFFTSSTLACDSINIEICSACHPFYTGKQKVIDKGGRIKKFNDRYHR